MHQSEFVERPPQQIAERPRPVDGDRLATEGLHHPRHVDAATARVMARRRTAQLLGIGDPGGADRKVHRRVEGQGRNQGHRSLLGKCCPSLPATAATAPPCPDLAHRCALVVQLPHRHVQLDRREPRATGLRDGWHARCFVLARRPTAVCPYDKGVATFLLRQACCGAFCFRLADGADRAALAANAAPRNALESIQ